jgi:hypothetical protein
VPGVLQKRPPDRDEIWIQELRVRGHCKKLPISRRVLQALVNALLIRISIVKDKTEEKWLRREIEGLAGLEDICNGLQESPDTAKAEALGAWLLKIQRSKVPRDRLKDHDPKMLRIQRRAVNEVIVDSRYLNYSFRDRRQWLQDHWTDMMSTLHGIPCWCDYDVNDLVKPPRQATLDELVQCGTGAELQKEILAELHDIKPREVEKLLAPRSK